MDRQLYRDRRIGGDGQTETDRNTQTRTHADQQHRQAKTDRHRHRQTETGRHRHRRTEIDLHSNTPADRQRQTGGQTDGRMITQAQKNKSDTLT